LVLQDENTKVITTNANDNVIANFFMFKIEMAVLFKIKISQILLLKIEKQSYINNLEKSNLTFQ
jgi:hypothetical protein